VTFTARLITALFDAQWQDHRDNHDEFRFGPAPPETLRVRLGRASHRIAASFGFRRRDAVCTINTAALEQWAPLFPDLDWLYETLADDVSRDLLVQLVAYRLLGKRAVKLPLNTPAYWKRVEELRGLADPDDSIAIDFIDWKLLLHDLTPIGYPVRLYIRSPMNQFELRQYCCDRAGFDVAPGDVVIDGGACWGDSALFFVTKTGNEGRVLSCEFVPGNLEVFHKNLSLNPDMAKSIELVPHALWSTSGVPLYVNGRGPGSSVSTTPSTPGQTPTATTLSIDDMVRDRGLERVDFIKMDIEGAEYEALQGAAATLQRYRPKLALCIYHCPEDFVRLARYVDKLTPGYRIFLRHLTVHAEETVLYALPFDDRRAS
jgi:FkbM family methyltransferase